MTYGITRERAVALLEIHLKEPHLRKHALASEAVMIRLAQRLQEDEGKWGLAGLLHDLDAEETAGDMTRHTHRAARLTV